MNASGMSVMGLKPNFPTVAEWKAIVAEFQKPSLWRAVVQLVDTLVPYAVLWVGIYWAL